MKRALTIIFGAILVISLHAQTGVFYTYGYDSAGNRTLRNYVSPINSPTPVLTDYLPSQSIVPKAVTKRYSSQDVFLLSSEKESDKEFEKYVAEWEDAMRELLKKKGSAQLDRSTYDFGAIPCQDGVSPSGARTYTVPIPVAPGTKMAPSIALGYNSQAGDGWAGFGWDIQGISTITVINKNIYYHGVAEAADTWQTDAVFALDGIPLVTNTNTANNSVYPLVTASGHIFVKRNDNSQGKPDTFTVLYPDGSIATYGFGCISNFYYPAYPIVEREDILGNLCTYTYHHNLIDGHYYPDTIEYGYQSGGTPQGKIVFNYNSRTDYTLRYYAGRKIYTDQILSSISSKSGSESLCTYLLYYMQTDNTELLTEIRCQSSTQYIPPLSFTYGDPTLPQSGQIMKSSNSVSLSTWFDSNSKYLLRRGKFMSNNYGDCLLAYLDLKNYAVTHYHPQVSPPAMFYEYGSQYASDRRLNILCRTSDGGYTSVDNSIAVGSGFQTAEPVDVDGDGVDEIVKVNFDGTSNNKTVLRLTTYKCNTSGTPVQQNTFTVSINGTVTSGSYVSPSRRVYYWGDFLCNGKTQLLALATDNTGCGANQTQTCYASLIDIEGQTVLSDSVLFTFPFSDAEHNTFAIDLDSDGKTELCHATTQGLDVYSVGTSNTFALETTYTDITSSILSSTTSPVLNLADVNGDGYVDIVTLPFMLPSGSISSSDVWTVYYFTGHSFMIDTLSITTRSATDKYFLIDVDRDGMADLVKIALGSNNSSSFGVYLNQNGSTFSSYVQSTDTISSTNHIVPINGMEYNLASCFIAIDGSTLQDYSYTRPAPLVRRTASMTDSYGRVLTSMYRYLPDRSTSWTTSSYTPTTADGYTKKVIPVYVLEVENAYLTSSLTNKYRYNIYAYDDLVLHSWGLGFCGFVQTRTRDAYHYPHYCTITTYDPEKRGVVTRVQTGLQVFAAVPFKSVDYTYDSHFTTYGKLNPRLIESVAEDGLTGITTTTEYDNFNNYDFPQYILTTRSDGSATHTQLCRRFYQNVVSTTRSVLGILTEERIWQEASSSQTGTWNERDYYSYNSSYLPVSRWHYVGQVSSGTSATNLESTTQWTYDTYGNVLSEESAPYNVTTFLGTSYTYDNDGRFLISSTDEFGHTTSFSGYNKYGKPTSVTDYQERSNSMSYDSWGNLVSTTYADGTVETTSTDWGGNGLYRVSHTRTGMMPERTDYDALGREVHHGVQRYNGAWLQVDRLYDSNGYLWKVSLPYKYNGPAYWNRYSYDVYGRKTAYWEASGRTTSWSYYGTDVTTEEDGIATTRTTDPSGRLIAITDDGGTVTYNLRDDGQPLSITAPGNVVTSFTYDAFGRRTQLSDPSAGTQSDSWTWYANGTSSHTHTNANGSITTYNDPHGRPTYVSHPSGYSGYTYDSYDRLSQVDSDSGASVSYTYDAYDRIATLQSGAPDSKYLKKTYTYGSGSVVSSIKYTSQDGDMATENYTYSNGQLTSIRLNNNQYIWSLSNENDLGQTTQCTTLGITRQYGYDAYGYPTSRSITNSGITLQDFSYVIDPETGNLTSRTDETRNITESFTYDSLNRLSYIGSNSVTYNGKGNITSIGQVGSMLYGNSSAPYRISAFIPENGVSIRPHSQSVTYTAFDRPSTITENDTSATLTYDTDGQRVMMVVAVNNVETMRRYYMDDRYEIDQASSTTTERLYLGGDAYSAPVVMQRTGNGSWSMYLLGRDNQGSVTHVISSSGTLLNEYSYTPWGRLRNPATQVVYTPGAEPALFTGRGYTGHEHLNEFGLINMNARLYDPLLGRFLSPDPYVQAPDFSQNFNRYAYALNNPLKYVDLSGLFFLLDSWLIGLIGGGYERANKMLVNDLKIWGGLFIVDKNKGFLGATWELLSRFLYQGEQTMLGFLSAQAINTWHLGGGVNSVEYLHGATVLSTSRDKWGAFTMGSYIMGGDELKAENSNGYFQHEYGHYLQSQVYGPLYIMKIAIPSVFSKKKDYHPHFRNPTEQDANIRAFKYFKENYPNDFDSYNAKGQYNGLWRWSRDTYGKSANPIEGIDWYKYETQQEHNNNVLSLSPTGVNWFDFPLLVFPSHFVGEIIGGFINMDRYNKTY